MIRSILIVLIFSIPLSFPDIIDYWAAPEPSEQATSAPLSYYFPRFAYTYYWGVAISVLFAVLTRKLWWLYLAAAAMVAWLVASVLSVETFSRVGYDSGYHRLTFFIFGGLPVGLYLFVMSIVVAVDEGGYRKFLAVLCLLPSVYFLFPLTY